MNQLNTVSEQKQIIFVRETQEDRNMMTTARTFMIFYMLFLFISSMTKGAPGASKGKPPKGGGMNSLMMDQGKSKRFLQQVNVKFDDVMGMQKAK